MADHEEEIEQLEVFDGDVIAPQISPKPYFKKGKKAPYRALTIPERDLLFALYEKHGSNMLAMTRDATCQFKSYAQLKWYCDFYHFYPRFVEIRRKQAQAAIAGLTDGKARAIARALEMIEPKQVALKNRDGDVLTVGGEPAFETVCPDAKTLKIAWEIIKAELGEPTMVSKSDITSKGQAITSISVNVVHGAQAASDDGVRAEPPKSETNNVQSGGDGKQ